jgi:hypothetical protein
MTQPGGEVQLTTSVAVQKSASLVLQVHPCGLLNQGTPPACFDSRSSKTSTPQNDANFGIGKLEHDPEKWKPVFPPDKRESVCAEIMLKQTDEIMMRSHLIAS